MIADRSHRPVSEVTQQLADLASARSALESIDSPDFVTVASLASLTAHEDELKTELAAASLADAGQTMEFVLDGDAVVGHTVEASFLADMLGYFQRMLDGVAEAREGNSRTRGRVAEQIRASVRIMVADFVPGSFGVRLVMPDQPDQLFGDDVLESTLSLFASEPAVEDFLPLMRLPRVKANYEAMMKSLVSHQGKLAITTESRISVRFAAETARHRLEWIGLVETSQSPIDVSGILVGGDVERRTYVLTVDDVHYRGKVLDIALDELRRVTLGSYVRARLLHVTKAQVDDIVIPAEEFYLESVNALPEPNQPRLDDGA